MGLCYEEWLGLCIESGQQELDRREHIKATAFVDSSCFASSNVPTTLEPQEASDSQKHLRVTS